MKMSAAEDFNVIQFEKRLTQLKDSQDHINACCKWCLENRQHHKKIVTSWLNVLKRVKIEQRVNLFYLANDVIQYSKRKRYDFVDSWGTALQKATTLVRDDKVKHKVIRIFNIWQQRGVYNEEFISDLCGLISVVPTASKNDEPHEFQASYAINKIKQCSKLEADTDTKLKVLKEHNPRIQIETDSLCASLKDRAHVDDVEKELETYVKHLEGYINALKAEIKCRIANISVLKQANQQLDKDKKDVKVVANAYKVFGNKIKAFQKKLDEHKSTLASPVPSPDIDAPSPGPDSDIELPDDDAKKPEPPAYNPAAQFTAGYYNPVPPPATTAASGFVANGYTSFIGSTFDASTLFTNTQTTPVNNSLTQVTDSGYSDLLQSMSQPPPPPEAPRNEGFQYQGPLLPPPMPPFSTKSDFDGSYTSTYSSADTSNSFAVPYTSTDTVFSVSFDSQPPEEYNPEQEPDTWEGDASWQSIDTETPESPPTFEKEGYVEGAEYHDTGGGGGAAADVDHRVLRPLDSDIRGRGKDVDHRNLISLTGSPAERNLGVPPPLDLWKSTVDQDYRAAAPTDQDYRTPPPTPFNLEQLKLPPPPPPPPKRLLNSPRKSSLDNVESIDMELSEDETEMGGYEMPSLKPPPPFPDLPDDVDANSFLDEFTEDINSGEFTANLRDYAGVPPPPFPRMRGAPPPGHWPAAAPRQNFGFRGRGNGHRGGGGNFNRPRGRGRGFRGGHFRGRRGARGNVRGNFNNFNNFNNY